MVVGELLPLCPGRTQLQHLPLTLALSHCNMHKWSLSKHANTCVNILPESGEVSWGSANASHMVQVLVKQSLRWGRDFNIFLNVTIPTPISYLPSRHRKHLWFCEPHPCISGLKHPLACMAVNIRKLTV